ncbi:peptide/nickel transport system substrate-binding protein [Paracoccus alcaliphilus]|uniref:Peptide/nickel transport system substrate-binding protein n=1 Tax=Paracoccus alcaliphilus TaxID=34002 RepID=A0A1H8HGP2_9RHOB|nr:ABC transporter substrate-binding protein [Paracoccus alcaliphilus]WCR20711.1 ABC transporter substrate-binding protein [Paracoccus alcaliphilus]SEN55285.1 peptide/nickel transport system substrate-binding protein [Paracoccus alcaliphilus]
MTFRATCLASAAVFAVCAAGPLAAQNKVDVAIVGDPDTFDPMISTKDVVSIVTQHFMETLYTFDESWQVVPLLASDMPTISEDGTTYTIPLREGVSFHDGSQMDSADVVASLNRWQEVASRGMAIADRISGIEATGPAEITITLSEPYAPLTTLLAFSNSAAVIYPEEIIAPQITDPIGTGPYRMEAHQPDQYTQLVRFDDYAQPGEAAGERAQTPDEIRFIPVPDTSTRIEGLLSGQFDYADSLSTEAFGRIEASDVAEPVLLEAFGWPLFAVNHKKGLMTDLNIRRAVQAALPYDDMLFAAFGDEKFFQTDGALYPEGWPWHNEAGIELYNINDPEKAAEYLDAAGYDGQPLRILTSRQYEFHYQMAEVAQMALEMAGFTVQMDVVDWATLAQNRDNPDLWDIYITHSPFLPEPTLTSSLFATAREGWANPEKEAILERFTAESDPDARKDIYAELQQQLYEDVGLIKIGNFNEVQGKSRSLTGVTPSPWPTFWNASKDQ